MAFNERRIEELRQQAGGEFSGETEQLLARWAWNTPEAEKVWTVVPRTGTRLRCQYEPPCHFHAEGGAPGEMCRWRRVDPASPSNDTPVGNPKPLSEATEGDVFRHASTGAVIVVVEHRRDGELLTVQLNDVEGHTPGWVGVMWTHDGEGWSFVRVAA